MTTGNICDLGLVSHHVGLNITQLYQNDKSVYGDVSPRPRVAGGHGAEDEPPSSPRARSDDGARAGAAASLPPG